jgi:hypothetical protein
MTPSPHPALEPDVRISRVRLSVIRRRSPVNMLAGLVWSMVTRGRRGMTMPSIVAIARRLVENAS